MPAHMSGAAATCSNAVGDREGVAGVGGDELRVPAVALVARELGAVAEVLPPGTAVEAVAARPAEPRHPDAIALRESGSPRPRATRPSRRSRAPGRAAEPGGAGRRRRGGGRSGRRRTRRPARDPSGAGAGRSVIVRSERRARPIQDHRPHCTYLEAGLTGAPVDVRGHKREAGAPPVARSRIRSPPRRDRRAIGERLADLVDRGAVLERRDVADVGPPVGDGLDDASA